MRINFLPNPQECESIQTRSLPSSRNAAKLAAFLQRHRVEHHPLGIDPIPPPVPPRRPLSMPTQTTLSNIHHHKVPFETTKIFLLSHQRVCLAVKNNSYKLSRQTCMGLRISLEMS